MQTANRLLASLFLTAALAVPMSVVAAPAPQAAVSVRVYDSNHKDYHNWDDNEHRAWGQYLSDNHRKDHDYAKSKKSEQSDYWKWRHNHPDDKR